jgi:Fe-S-cluster containining protein
VSHNAGESAWYVIGLAFECVGCGACCAGPAEGYVWATEREIAAIAEHLGINEVQMYRAHVREVGRRFSLKERPDTKDCVFLEPAVNGKRGCQIYPVRPTQCRTWPFWSSNVDTPEAWALAGARCSGINRGSVYSPQQVQERRDATRE